MADDKPQDDTEAAPVAPEAKKGLPVKMILMIAIPVVLLAIGGIVAFFMLSGKEEDKKNAEAVKKAAADLAAEAAIDPKNLLYVDVPEILVNIYNSGPRVNFLKTSITLEVGTSKDQEILKALLPKILDQFLVYFRGVTIEDLRGSAGFQKLREELLLRANAVAAPIKVRDILFKSLIVQ